MQNKFKENEDELYYKVFYLLVVQFNSQVDVAIQIF